MNLARRLLTLAAAMCLVVAVPAQEARARVVEQRLATATAASLEWFHQGCELVLAQANVDLRRAQATADQLWQAAQQDAPVGAAATSAALLAHILTRSEGPAMAAPWLQRAAELPAPTAPLLAAYHQLARAWQLCSSGDHAAELAMALAAQPFAEQSGDEVLRIRAVMATLHGRPDRSIQTLQQALDAAKARGAGPEVEFLRCELMFLAARTAKVYGDEAKMQELADEVAARSTASGDRRMSAALGVMRMSLAFDAGDVEATRRGYAELSGQFEQLGDRLEMANALDLRGWLAIRADQLEVAKQMTDACLALIEGRGMKSVEKDLLQTRFELAVRMRDGDTAEKLSHQLDESARDRVAANEHMEVVRAQLRRAEENQQAAEQQLLAEQHRATQQAWRTQWFAGIGIIVALAAIAVIAWVSRRRLKVANGKLEDQVQKVEAAQAAQAKLEQRMRQMERTESLGTMAAGIAHDFNNLLTSMIGGAELLSREVVASEQRDLAGMILSAGRQGARLCQQLQAYAGGTPPTPMRHDLLQLTNDMLPTLRASVGEGVEVRLTIDSTAVMVSIDRGQFEQMLLNLVQNSREAGATGVRIRVSPAGGGTQPAVAQGAQIEVVDDGRGMEPEVAHRIFDPFFTTKFPGRGLGLAVVHGVVRRHGGTIRVNSARGDGSTFVIHIPAAGTAPAAEAVASEVPATVPAGLVALVVDDEPAVRRVLAMFLGNLGLEVHQAGSGDEALAIAGRLHSTAPAIAFVDLTMPGMDGVEAVARLLAQAPRLRIVLMSGHAGGELERVAQECAASGSLTKPFLLADVRTVLAAVAAGAAAGARDSVSASGS